MRSNFSPTLHRRRKKSSVAFSGLFDEYGFQRATTNTAQGTATILKPRTFGAVFSAEF